MLRRDIVPTRDFRLRQLQAHRIPRQSALCPPRATAATPSGRNSERRPMPRGRAPQARLWAEQLPSGSPSTPRLRCPARPAPRRSCLRHRQIVLPACVAWIGRSQALDDDVRAATTLRRIIMWNSAMISRASTRVGTPASMAATVTVSAFERGSLPIV
jgi:hypothetical protein